MTYRSTSHGLLAALLALAAGAAQAQGQRGLPAPAIAAPLPASASASSANPRPGVPQMVSHGLFSDIEVYRPAGAVRQFVMIASPNDALSTADRQLARAMAGSGAMVAAIPMPPFQRRLDAQGGKCAYAAGAFENLARQVQAFDKLPTYLEPMVIGADDTAALAYTLVAQAPAGTFSSAMSIGFCPRVTSALPPCASNALRWHANPAGTGVELEPTAIPAPWIALQSGREPTACPAAAQAFTAQVPQATWVRRAPTRSGQASQSTATSTAWPAGVELAYAKLAAQRIALDPPPPQLADLPIIEVPAEAAAGSAGTANANRFAVLLSGDGGWASIDKSIAAALAKQGVPVAGWDSLRYFWSARTPEGLATDVDRVVRYYAARWKRSEVILIGYSQGADVLPFAINRLPPRTRASVRLAAMLGLGQKAAFEFHVSHWIGPAGDKPIAPEARKLNPAAALCIYGTDEKDSLCPELAPEFVRALVLPGGHHFGGDYDALAARILDAVPR